MSRDEQCLRVHCDNSSQSSGPRRSSGDSARCPSTEPFQVQLCRPTTPPFLREEERHAPLPSLFTIFNIGKLNHSITHSQRKGALRGNYFSYNLCEDSMFCFSPQNHLRRRLFFLVDNLWFERVMLIIIVLNCIALVFRTPGLQELGSMESFLDGAEIFFQIVFTFEMVVKVVALGFVLHEHSYLRSVWNRIDFVIVILGFASFAFDSNFSAVRMIRVLRPLLALSKLPELASIVRSLVNALPRIRDGLLILVFVLFIFSVLGLQMFAGTMSQRCYTYSNLSDVPQLVTFETAACSKSDSYGHQCPANSVCEVHKDIYRRQLLSFDHMGYSLVSVFKLMSLDLSWPETVRTLQETNGLATSIYSFLAVLIGAYVALRILLAILLVEFTRTKDNMDSQNSGDNDQHQNPETFSESDNEDQDEAPEKKKKKETPPLQNPQKGAANISAVLRWQLTKREAQRASYREKDKIQIMNDERKHDKPQDSKISIVRKVALIVVQSNAFNGFMIFVTLLNVVILAIDHHNISSKLEDALDLANLICTILFIVEMILKFYALRLTYFYDGFNRFDFMLVIISIPEMIFSGQGSAFSALRVFRLARILRILRAKDLRIVVLTTLKAAVGAMYIILLLFLFLLISALVGVNLFKEAYPMDFRPHFRNLGDALITVTFLVTGQGFIQIGEMAMNGTSWFAIFYFIAVFALGSYIVLSLFVALLIDEFHTTSASDVEEDEEMEDEKALRVALMNEIIEHRESKRLSLTAVSLQIPAAEAAENPLHPSEDFPSPLSKINCEESGNDILGLRFLGQGRLPDNSSGNDIKNAASPTLMRQLALQSSLGSMEFSLDLLENNSFICTDHRDNSTHSGNNDEAATVVAYQTLSPFVGRKNSSFKGAILKGNSLCIFSATNSFRVNCAKFVFHPFFDWAILFVILVSCVFSCLEHPGNDGNHTIYQIMRYGDVAFLVIFAVEAILHAIAEGLLLGDGAYLSDNWNRADFIVVIAAFIGILVPIFRTLRVVRCLRFTAKADSLRATVTMLFRAIPTLANTLLLTLFVFVVFGILGVQLFKGSFVYCTDPTITLRSGCMGFFNVTQVSQQLTDNGLVETFQTEVRERTWEHAFLNFNHLGMAILSLFVLATNDAWAAIVWQVMDSKDYDHAMQPYTRPHMAVFVLLFVIVGGYFIMNLFIGALIDSFTRERDITEGRRDEEGRSHITDNQLLWIRTFHVARKSTFPSPPPPPESIIRRFCCTLCFSDDKLLEPNKVFEWTVTAMILVNAAVMCVHHDGISRELQDALFWIRVSFAVAYAAEAAIRIVALLPRGYFAEGWNRFDFALVLLAFASLAAGAPATNSLRVLRVARVFRLLKNADGLQRLFTATLNSIPQLINALFLLLLCLFVFGLFGTILFGRLSQAPETSWSSLHEFYNFRHAGYSMIALFQSATTGGWWDVMESCMITPHNSACRYEDNNCGTDWAILYFVSFILVASAVVMNLFIFVVVDNYSEVQQTTTDPAATCLEMIELFRDSWLKADPDLTQVLHWRTFIKILRKLPPKFGFGAEASDQRLLSRLKIMDIPLNASLEVTYDHCVEGLTREPFRLGRRAVFTAFRQVAMEEEADPRHLKEFRSYFKVSHVYAMTMIRQAFEAYVQRRYNRALKSGPLRFDSIRSTRRLKREDRQNMPVTLPGTNNRDERA